MTTSLYRATSKDHDDDDDDDDDDEIRDRVVVSSTLASLGNEVIFLTHLYNKLPKYSSPTQCLQPFT